MTCDDSKNHQQLDHKYDYEEITCDWCGGYGDLGIRDNGTTDICPQCNGDGTIVMMIPKETIIERNEHGKQIR